MFIFLGSFHIELAIFSIFGKIIAESGGPDILNECEVLAEISWSSFYKRTNYNQWKHMHEPLSLAMQILYFERFLHKQEDKIDLLEILKRDSGYKLEVEKECTILFSK